MLKCLLFRSSVFCKLWRVIKTHVNYFDFGREIRAVLMGMIADRYYVIKVLPGKFSSCLRSLGRDINACFGHDLDGFIIHPMFLDPGRMRFDHITFQMFCPSFGHLAPARVAGTEKKDLSFIFRN